MSHITLVLYAQWRKKEKTPPAVYLWFPRTMNWTSLFTKLPSLGHFVIISRRQTNTLSKEHWDLVCGPGAAVLADAIVPRFSLSLVVDVNLGISRKILTDRSLTKAHRFSFQTSKLLPWYIIIYIYNLIPYPPRAWILKTSMGRNWIFTYSPICPISGRRWDAVFSLFWGRSISY